jgi:regulator of protease activity HflC (stomatin/prohibitin superfamily)
MLRVNWRRFFVTLAVGIVPTAASYLLGWWWGGTLFALLTLLGMLPAFPRPLYPVVFTLYAVVAITLIAGALIENALPAEWAVSPRTRTVTAGLFGLLVGIGPVALFWFGVLYVSTTWILVVSKSFDVSWGQAFKFVASQTFQLSQAAIIVQNGDKASERPPEMLSRFGGPGFLVVGVGNACVLERAGRVTRVVGPGLYPLTRFERLKEPLLGKGIIDLRPQFVQGVAEEVRTKDGIPLTIKVGESFQIEPKEITDARPESRFLGGDATTPLLGGPEHPVYERIVRKAVFNVPPEGWKSGWFPSGPIHHLRDVVATYTLNEIFNLDKPEEKLSADGRVVQSIEDEVKNRFAPAASGVWFKELDIREISMPEELEEKIKQRWAARVERELKIAGAEAERDAMFALSEGRADSLRQLEGVRLIARSNLVDAIQIIASKLPPETRNQVIMGCIDMFQGLAQRAGQDETVAMRYIEAMQAFVQSPGPKSFVITPPNPSPGFLPSAPSPTPAGWATGGQGQDRKKDTEPAS